MKKLYMNPELEVVELSLKDVIMTSPTEGNIPIEGNTDTSLPDNELE